MDSSIIVAFRAFVMLACLILVPLAAIFGSAFPDVVRSVLLDRFLPRQPEHAAQTQVAEAPRFGQSGSASPYRFDSPAETARSGGESWPAREGVQQAAAWTQAAPNHADTSRPQPPIAQIPAGSPASRSNSEAPAWQGGPGSDWRGSSAPNTGYSQPTSPQTSVPPSPLATPGAPVPGALAAGAQSQSDHFSAMERRLRQYGATYYRLESWGNDPGLYRFYCRMAVGNSANVTQNFEATDKDALQAMTRVMSQVEDWRTRR